MIKLVSPKYLVGKQTNIKLKESHWFLLWNRVPGLRSILRRKQLSFSICGAPKSWRVRPRSQKHMTCSRSRGSSRRIQFMLAMRFLRQLCHPGNPHLWMRNRLKNCGSSSRARIRMIFRSVRSDFTSFFPSINIILILGRKQDHQGNGARRWAKNGCFDKESDRVEHGQQQRQTPRRDAGSLRQEQLRLRGAPAFARTLPGRSKLMEYFDFPDFTTFLISVLRKDAAQTVPAGGRHRGGRRVELRENSSGISKSV